MVEAFEGAGVEGYYLQVPQQLRLKLYSMPDAQVREAETQSLVDHLAHQFLIERVDEDPDRPPEAPEDGSFVKVFLVPRRYNGRSVRHRASRWLSSPSYRQQIVFDEHEHALVLRVPYANVAHALGLLRQNLSALASDIDKFTPDFMQTVWNIVRRRQAELADVHRQTQTALEAAGVRIVRKTTAVEPVNVQVKREVQLLRSPEAPPVKRVEPTLDPESLSQILALVEQAGHGFEVTPAVFGSLGEEDLRTIILGYLNAVFARPAATGETFSVSGKTDILLNVSNGAVLVGECHWWDGEKTYIEKLEQLFGYLSFRNTSAMMITFSDRSSLTDVVTVALGAVDSHPTCLGASRRMHKTNLKSDHQHPRDSEKRIEVYHLFFDLRRPEGAVRGAGTRRKR